MADVFVFKVPCGEKCSGYQENLKKINKLTFLKCLDANVKIFILPRITLIVMFANTDHMLQPVDSCEIKLHRTYVSELGKNPCACETVYLCRLMP